MLMTGGATQVTGMMDGGGGTSGPLRAACHRQVIDIDVAPRGPDSAMASAELRTVSGDPVAGGASSVLVRVHGSPVARLDLDLPDGVDEARLLAAVRPRVAEAVAEHLRADGLPSADDEPAAHASRLSHLDGCAAWLPVPRPAPRVTVVIPTVGRDDLAGCLDSLLMQEYDDYEIVVVDNSTSAQRHELLDRIMRGRNDPSGRLRRVAEPRPGVSHARNRGLTEATGSLVAFVDDDVLVDPRWLRALVAAFEVGPGVACVTGLVLPWQLETTEQTWFEQYGGFGKGFTRRVFDLESHRGEHVLYPYLPGQYGTGANIAYRTEFLRDLGGFDPALGGRRPVVGGEDIDVLLRTVLSGAALVYEPQALLWYQPYREYTALQRQMVIYGRGLAAVILKAMLADRATALDVARRLPAGLRFLLDPGSGKNAGKHDFPADLTRRELAGVISGPFAYMWARLKETRVKGAGLKGAGLKGAGPRTPRPGRSAPGRETAAAEHTG
jgi:glycosyltransferase involved in cell wall biosynthesis